MAKNIATVPGNRRRVLAREIRALAKGMALNSIELGLKLRTARDTFPLQVKGFVKARPGWEKWARKETGLRRTFIYSLIRVADKFGGSATVNTAKISGKILILLARDKVPEAARQEIINRANSGERITMGTATRVVHGHRLPPGLPKPTEANSIARDTGQAQLASDGYIYFGTSPEDAKAGENRRTVVYGIKRAVTMLAKIDMTPEHFLMYALPHQLWDDDEAVELGKAETWLAKLCEAWSGR